MKTNHQSPQQEWEDEKLFLVTKIKYLTNDRTHLLQENREKSLKIKTLEDDFKNYKQNLVKSLENVNGKMPLTTSSMEEFNLLKLQNQKFKEKISEIESEAAARQRVLEDKVKNLQDKMVYYKGENKFLRDSLAVSRVGVSCQKSRKNFEIEEARKVEMVESETVQKTDLEIDQESK